MADLTRFSITVVAFALLVTSHFAIVIGLVSRPPRSRAALAFLVPPLAPSFAAREHMWFRAGVWMISALVYVGSLFMQAR